MMVSGAGGPHRSRYRSHLTTAFLILSAAAILLRTVAIAEPLGIDQSLWASAVRGMSRGQLLYRDVWEQRPPGIYWTYLAGFRMLGWTPSTVAWLDIVAAAATTVLIYAVTRALAAPLVAALAAALYAVLTMPAWLYSYGGFLERSVCETFIVVCVAAGAWIAVRWRGTGVAGPFAVGLAAGAAMVFKPNAGLYFPALLLWMFFYRVEKPAPARAIVRPLLAAVIGLMLMPAMAFIWLWRLNLLHDAGVAVIDFNRFYVSQGFSIGPYSIALAKALWLRIKTEPLWLAGAAGAVAAVADLLWRRRLPPLAGLAVLWGGAGALVIVVNGAFLFNSYFIQAHAPLAILGAWFLAEAAHGSRARAAAGIAIALLMAGLLVQRNYPARISNSAGPDFAFLRGRIDRNSYLERFGSYANGRGYSARANTELADYVRDRTEPEDRIFLFGINGAGVYFEANRLTAHRFLRANFFVETTFPDPRFRLDAVTADLEAARPRYLIFETLHSPSVMGRAVDALPQEPQVARLLAAYRRETQIEDFTLYRRVD